MKNEDCPASPTEGKLNRDSMEVLDYQVADGDVFRFTGETKRENAFWQVYSAMLIDPEHRACDYYLIADRAIAAVNVGFKVLEQGD